MKAPSIRSVIRLIGLSLIPLFSIVTVAVGVNFMVGGYPDWMPNRFWSLAYGAALIYTGLFALRSYLRVVRRMRSRGYAAEQCARHDALRRAAFPNETRSL